MRMENILIASGLTLMAGLSTGIGGLFAFFSRRTNTKLLSVILGFSAGVMIYVSFVEIFPEAKKHLILQLGEKAGLWVTVAAFFGGMFLIALIDKLIPTASNPHESHKIEEMDRCDLKKSKKLLKTGLLTASAVMIHNFPEGLATFTAALQKPSLGIAIAVAIAIHNIPEGIAVSIPVFCATGNRKKAFFLSFISGFAEPLGAITGYLFLLPFINDTIFGILFAAVAGIMVFISLDELLPTAKEYGEHHLSAYGLIGGMIVMALSLLLLN